MWGINAPHMPFKCRFFVMYHINVIKQTPLVYWAESLLYHINLDVSHCNMIKQCFNDKRHFQVCLLNLAF